jgi:hypothetical protein
MTNGIINFYENIPAIVFPNWIGSYKHDVDLEGFIGVL